MNTIQIKFDQLDAPEDIAISHNGQPIENIIIENNSVKFSVDECPAANCLAVSIQNKSISKIKIEWITMFNLGKDKLVYHGNIVTPTARYQSQDILPGTSWELHYNYPTFSWLHNILDHGWLVK
jgi:hypothetical protein